MRTIAIAVLCLGLVGPVMADTPSAGANPQIPNTGGTPENVDLPMPAASGSGDGYVAPSKDVPMYVPLSDAQQELPTMDTSEGYDYAPGMEGSGGAGTAPKEITDQVPAQ